MLVLKANVFIDILTSQRKVTSKPLKNSVQLRGEIKKNMGQGKLVELKACSLKVVAKLVKILPKQSAKTTFKECVILNKSMQYMIQYIQLDYLDQT